MGLMFRYFLMLMAVLTALSYYKTAREAKERAANLPLAGDQFCRHLPENLQIKCREHLGGYRFDPLAVNFCVSHAGEIDFVCLSEIKNAVFQTNMVSLCAGHDTSYLRLCLMALRNKEYSEGEKDYCAREDSSPDLVFCLSRYGHSVSI